MLTRRGWSLVGAATGLYIGSRLLGLVQLVVLAGIGLLLLAVAAVWVRSHPVRLHANRHLRERLQVGVDGRVDVVVESTSTRRMPTLSVSDAFDRGRRSARFLLAPLEPGEDRRGPRTGSPPIGAVGSRSDRCARRSPTRSVSRAARGASLAPKR